MAVPDNTEFKSLEEFVSEKTLNAITDMGFTNMMEIQHKSIVPLLKGRYVCTFTVMQIIFIGYFIGNYCNSVASNIDEHVLL